VQTFLIARQRLPAFADPIEPDQLAGPITDAPDALLVRFR
jgi:hypothetical protein